MSELFLTRPALIRAVRLTDTLASAVIFDKAQLPFGLRVCSSEYNERLRTVRHCTVCIGEGRDKDERCQIGDWIVQHENGMLSAMDDEQFQKYYQPINQL